MPWLALPFEKRDLESKICNKYNVTGIPTLVVLDEKDEVGDDEFVAFWLTWICFRHNTITKHCADAIDNVRVLSDC